MLRIGTATEKSGVEKELQELRDRLGRVEGWKRRREEIEEELGRVWVEGKEEGARSELRAPEYEGEGREGAELMQGDAVSEGET